MPYGIQQPAISGQLSQLEKTLEAKLFHRRPFGLTPAGAKLFLEIEPFFAGLRDLPHQIREQASQRLRLAAPSVILRDFLPKIFMRYKREHRDFQLTLHDANQAIAEELLRKREIDIAITELEGNPASSVNSCVLLSLPLVLVIPTSATFRALGDVFCDHSPSQNLISLPADEVISKNFQAGLGKLGLSWTPTVEVSSLELVDLYTSLGFGIGLSIGMPRPKSKSSVRSLPLRKFPPLTIAALWSGQLSEPAATFFADIENLATKLSPRREP
jgi:DNA-binding transcriptional LysR family regulator